MKYTKNYYKLWMMIACALGLGTVGWLLNNGNSYQAFLSILSGVAAGIYFGHSFGIVIYYLCKWRYPDRVKTESEDKHE